MISNAKKLNALRKEYKPHTSGLSVPVGLKNLMISQVKINRLIQEHQINSRNSLISWVRKVTA